MSTYTYNLKNKSVLDKIRSPQVYQFNLARNMALMSNDVATIRNFFTKEAPALAGNEWEKVQIKDRFMAQYREGQAFVYFGICPMIVEGKVNLVASSGFTCKSDNAEIDDRLNEISEEAEIQKLFEDGVSLESGLGDFAYRLSYNPKISDMPLIDVIEPQNLDVNYEQGHIKSFVITRVAEDDSNYQLKEIHFKLNNGGGILITYRFFYDGKYVAPNDYELVKQCAMHFPEDLDLRDKVLPFNDFMIVYKQNTNTSRLYKGERGVPDIQGLDTIEDGLTESISDLVDAIRKGGIKEYVSDELIGQDADGNNLKIDHFNKTVITTKGSANPSNPKSLWQVTQAEIQWESYVKTIQNLMSVAINKAGLSPTTLGLTGLESINSSAESQEAREKTSIRTRERCLVAWQKTLTELLNKYLQVCDYIKGKTILDYSGLIKIHFNDYISPSVENITEVLVNQVAAGLKSQKHAIMELNKEYTEDDADKELLDILTEQGQPVLQDGLQEPVSNMENNTP